MDQIPVAHAAVVPDGEEITPACGEDLEVDPRTVWAFFAHHFWAGTEDRRWREWLSRPGQTFVVPQQILEEGNGMETDRGYRNGSEEGNGSVVGMRRLQSSPPSRTSYHLPAGYRAYGGLAEYARDGMTSDVWGRAGWVWTDSMVRQHILPHSLDIESTRVLHTQMLDGLPVRVAARGDHITLTFLPTGLGMGGRAWEVDRVLTFRDGAVWVVK